GHAASGSQVDQLLVVQAEVVDHVPEADGGAAHAGPDAGVEVVAGEQGLAAAVQVEQLLLGGGGGVAEQVGGHGSPSDGLVAQVDGAAGLQLEAGQLAGGGPLQLEAQALVGVGEVLGEPPGELGPAGVVGLRWQLDPEGDA